MIELTNLLYLFLLISYFLQNFELYFHDYEKIVLTLTKYIEYRLKKNFVNLSVQIV